MSALQRQVLRPPMPPPGRSGGKGMVRKRDYTPTKWDRYFDTYEDVRVTDQDIFRVYRNGNHGPLLLLLHGGGYCGLTWATLTASIKDMVECQVAALDFRGHGETRTRDDEDLSAETLSSDVGNIIHAMFGDNPPEIIMIGHSMGGAIAVHTAYRNLVPSLIGLAVIDVVEGTAMDALQSMQTFLRSRPTSFKTLDMAIEWCVRSGQVRNMESAKVSMPGQVKNSVTNKAGTSDIDAHLEGRPPSADETPAPLVVERGNIIQEEEEEAEDEEADEKKDEEKDAIPVGSHGDGAGLHAAASRSQDDYSFAMPSKPSDAVRYTWRIDLSKTEVYWPGWFQGLSNMFLACNVPKMLLLAGVDRLDKDLTIGQMQGKFQMQVLPQCGHAVHEDVPDKVSEVLATFMVRHKFVQATPNFTPTFPAC